MFTKGNPADRHTGTTTKMKHRSSGIYAPMCKADVTKSVGERNAISHVYMVL